MKFKHPEWMEAIFFHVADTIFGYMPQPVPSPTALKACRLISHRGEHLKTSAIENTIEAFDLAANAGVWGLEFDVRWTQDEHPVVFHDPDLKRLTGRPQRIDSLSLKTLQTQFPWIPTLENILHRYGKQRHLMIELKQSHQPISPQQTSRLLHLLEFLTPGEDFHLIGFDTSLFDPLLLPPQCFLPIASLNATSVSQQILQQHYGGIAGYYLMISDTLIQRHLNAGQAVMIGFVASPQSLYREINRGIQWIITNHAVRLQQFLETTHPRLILPSFHHDSIL